MSNIPPATTLALLFFLPWAGPAAFAQGKGNGGGGGGSPPPAPEIAFVESGLKVMNADGSNIRTLLRNSGNSAAGHPSWSPDGAHIIFPAIVAGQRGLYCIDADGANLRLITPTTAPLENPPSWSPVPTADGQYKIVFCDHHPGSINQDLYLVNIDGSGRTNLTWSASLFEGPASFSPDGQFLVAQRTGGVNQLVLYELGLTNGQIAIVSETLLMDFPPASAVQPRWAKTQSAIVMALYDGPGGAALRISILDLQQPEPTLTLLTPGTADERYPSFSTDDSRIVFHRSGQSTGGIYIINSDGTGEHRINAKGFAPSWR